MTDKQDKLASNIVLMLNDETGHTLCEGHIRELTNIVTGMITEHMCKAFFDAGAEEAQYYKSLKKAEELRKRLRG